MKLVGSNCLEFEEGFCFKRQKVSFISQNMIHLVMERTFLLVTESCMGFALLLNVSFVYFEPPKIFYHTLHTQGEMERKLNCKDNLTLL